MIKQYLRKQGMWPNRVVLSINSNRQRKFLRVLVCTFVWEWDSGKVAPVTSRK